MNNQDLVKDLYGDIVIQGNEQKDYIHFDFIYKQNLAEEMKLIKKSEIIKIGTPYEYGKFFEDLAEFEDKKAYKYTKDYKTIYAVKFTILMPQALKNDKQKRIAFIDAFVDSLNETTRIERKEMDERKKISSNIDDRLNYIAYEQTHGKGLYVSLLISEREYLSKPVYEKYNYTCYWNPETKRFCKKNDPGAVIKFMKGDYKLDSEGKKILNTTHFGTKIRRFSFKDFNRFMKKIHENFLLCYRRIINHIRRGFIIRQQKVMRIKQKRAYYGFHYFNRKCIEEVNHAIHYVEYTLNYMISTSKSEFKSYLDHWPEEYPLQSSTIAEIRERIELIVSLFNKYKNAFESGYLNTENKVIVVKTKGLQLDVLQQNIDELIQEFKKDCLAINPNTFTMKF